jgi:hypothetical protein
MSSKETLMSPLVRAVFLFVAVNALVGAISLMVFPNQTETLFFWKITPALSATMFGALYLGGAVAVTHAVWRRYWETARYLVPVLVAAGILLTLTTLLHLDRFTPGIRLAYWLIIYIGAPLLALAFWWYYEIRQQANWDVVGQAVTPLTRLLALVTGAGLVLFGVVAFVRPDLVIAVWPWPISPLMVRVFAAWFTAFAPGLFLFWWERDWNRLYPIASLMIAAAALDLLMTVVHRADLTGSPLQVAVFCAHLAAFGLIGVAMHLAQRQSAPRVPITAGDVA